MNLLMLVVYGLIIWYISLLPLHFAGLNKKNNAHMLWIRLSGCFFGWTIIGWIIALFIAFMPNPPE
jgi:hypothetical protein